MRKIKFRVWDKKKKTMHQITARDFAWLGENALAEPERFVVMQYTGLKDKNGDADIYECDIIDIYGNKKGNTYEMDAEETDLVIQDFGEKNWCSTYEEAMARGCRHSQ